MTIARWQKCYTCTMLGQCDTGIEEQTVLVT